MTVRRFVDPRTVLGRHALRPKKSFGQNFLVAGPIVEKIAAFCVTGSPTHVVEIGAGVGTLTSALLARGATVHAIEFDRELVPVLHDELGEDEARGAVEILEADAAEVDLRALLSSRQGDPGDRVLAGNLPYQITGKLLERATELAGEVARVVVMVQREVANRLVASPGSKEYGQLTVFAQAAFDVQRAFVVRAGCFYPIPEVDSAVVVLRPHAQPRAVETPTFRRVVHAAFGMRRKTLRNALAPMLGEDGARAAIAETGIDFGRRGETLSVEELAQVAERLAAFEAR